GRGNQRVADFLVGQQQDARRRGGVGVLEGGSRGHGDIGEGITAGLQDSVQRTGLFQFAMESEYLFTAGAIVFGEALGKVNRAVPAAGAADRDGQVTLVLAFESRQPCVEETLDVSKILYYETLPIEEFADGRVLARKRAQARVPVRVGQAARVEHEIAVGRQAAAVGEGFEHQREGARGGAEIGGDAAPQLVHVAVAGVDRTVGNRKQRAQAAAFLGDRVYKRAAFLRQRVTAAAAGVALQQDLVTGFQEHQFGIRAGLGKARQRFGQALEIAAVAYVH